MPGAQSSTKYREMEDGKGDRWRAETAPTAHIWADIAGYALIRLNSSDEVRKITTDLMATVRVAVSNPDS